MKYAVIDLGGKQFVVEEGTKFSLEYKEDPEAKVLFLRDGDLVLIGNPVVANANVTLANEGNFIKKTTIHRFKAKSRYRRTKGHKQPMSSLCVKKISYKSAKQEGKQESKKEEK